MDVEAGNLGRKIEGRFPLSTHGDRTAPQHPDPQATKRDDHGEKSEPCRRVVAYAP
jgi:hypothetical protein